MARSIARTDNGAATNHDSLDAVVDLFFLAGASRGKDLTGLFNKAFQNDEYLTLRLAQYVRDVRGGMGERKHFRDLLGHLSRTNPDLAIPLLAKTPEVGRWDDLLVVIDHPELGAMVAEMVRTALNARNGLCAKWMPRKGELAAKLRMRLGWTPKFYRKTLVSLSDTVEQKMCSHNWEAIDFSKLPSRAFSIYKRAFTRRMPQRFETFVKKVESGDPTVKINAGAIFPHDIVASLNGYPNDVADRAASAQWDSLPDYVPKGENVLVMADTSGSMTARIGSSQVTAMDVAVSLAMYMAERLTGPFKGTFLSFSTSPALQQLRGKTLRDRINNLRSTSWAMSTNLEAAFNLVLNTAVKASISQEQMPSKILIVSDMEFNACTNASQTALESIRRKYEAAGYKMPGIVFWNVMGRVGNSPATIKDKNTALVSGFSPAVIKSVFAVKNMDPVSVMMDALMNERYNLPGE